MKRKILTVVMLAAFHGGACWLVNRLTLAAAQASLLQAQPGWGSRFLVALAKILYLPILGLGLYPRGWFPGDLIRVPMALNSLIWGLGLYLAGVLVCRVASRPSRTVKQ